MEDQLGVLWNPRAHTVLDDRGVSGGRVAPASRTGAYIGGEGWPRQRLPPFSFWSIFVKKFSEKSAKKNSFCGQCPSPFFLMSYIRPCSRKGRWQKPQATKNPCDKSPQTTRTPGKKSPRHSYFQLNHNNIAGKISLIQKYQPVPHENHRAWGYNRNASEASY